MRMQSNALLRPIAPTLRINSDKFFHNLILPYFTLPSLKMENFLSKMTFLWGYLLICVVYSFVFNCVRIALVEQSYLLELGVDMSMPICTCIHVHMDMDMECFPPPSMTLLSDGSRPLLTLLSHSGCVPLELNGRGEL